MSIQLTEQQLEAVRVILTHYKNGLRYVCISGYAGTGKSTVVRFAIDALLHMSGLTEDDVVYTSFTGKATQVLLKKGNKNVSTLHKLLYEHKPLGKRRFKKIPRPHIGYKIVVVDEVSMVPKDLIARLFQHPVFIICLGDNH